MGVLDGLETTLKNCRLYYRWQYKKEADAPVVLLLHGWGCDSSIFSFIENAVKKLLGGIEKIMMTEMNGTEIVRVYEAAVRFVGPDELPSAGKKENIG